MAISLGRAALSFAGGVAEGINTKVEAEQKSRLKRQERAEDLKTQQKLNIQQSQYLDRVKKWEADNKFEGQLKAAGGDNDQLQRLIAKFNGLDVDILKAKQLRGDKVVPLSHTRSTSIAAPQPIGDDSEIGGQLETVGIVRQIMGVGPVEEKPTTETGKPVPDDAPKTTYGGIGTDWTLGAIAEFDTREVLNPDGTKTIQRFSKTTGLPVGEAQIIGKGGKGIGKGTPLPGTYTLPDSDEEFTLLQQSNGDITTIGGKPIDSTKLQLKGADPKDPSKIPGRWVNKDNEEVALFWKKGKPVDVKQNSVDMRELRLTDDPQGLSQANTFYRNNKNPNEIIKPVFDPQSPTGFTHQGKVLDLDLWTPITTDSLTATAAKNTRRTDSITASSTALGNLNQGLTDYTRIISEGLKGPAGVVLDVGSALSGTISGFGELLGVDAVPLAERIAVVEESGIDINEFIGSDKTALRGIAKQDAQLLIYSLAGVLKQNANQDRTGVADIKASANMIKALSATDSGIGATVSLQGFINTKLAGNNQELYQMPGVDTRKRAQSGINLLRLTVMKEKGRWKQAIDNDRVQINDITGEVSIVYPPIAEGREPITRTLDQVIMFQGKNGNLRPDRLINVR